MGKEHIESILMNIGRIISIGIALLTIYIHFELMIELELLHSPGIVVAIIAGTIFMGLIISKGTNSQIEIVLGRGILYGGVASAVLVSMFVMWFKLNYR